MNHYYLAASLPELLWDSTPPQGMEEFRFSCQGVLSQPEMAELDGVLAQDPTGLDNEFSLAWIDLNRALARALACLRMQRRGIAGEQCPRPEGEFAVDALAIAAQAMEQDDPLQREAFLDRIRWDFAEERTRLAPFGFPRILAHGVKLSILHRHAALDAVAGREALERLISHAAAPQEAA
jgi:hypothetical protein